MRKTILVLLAFFTSTHTFTQPTITSLSMPDIGHQITYTTYNQGSFNEGSSGEQVSWDFSNLILGTSDTYIWKNATGHPLLSDYPGSNALVEDGTGSVSFYYISDSIYRYIGSNWPSSNWIRNYSQDPYEENVMPFTYLDRYNSTFSGYNLSSPDTVQRIGTISMIADAYGTLVLPRGTFNDVLRIKFTVLHTNTRYGTKLTDYEEIYYSWIHPLHGDLISWGLVTVTNAHGAKNSYHIGSYVSSGTVGQNNHIEAGKNVNIFPNPVNCILNIETSADNSSLFIYNSQGQLLLQKQMNGNNQIDVSHLNEGIYFVKYLREDFHSTQKIIIRR